jgi:hypothetical protein
MLVSKAGAGALNPLLASDADAMEEMVDINVRLLRDLPTHELVEALPDPWNVADERLTSWTSMCRLPSR